MGTKRKSPKQGLNSAEDLTIELSESHIITVYKTNHIIISNIVFHNICLVMKICSL